MVDGRGERPWQEQAEVVAIEQHYLRVEELVTVGQTLTLNGITLASLSDEEFQHWSEKSGWSVRLRAWNDRWILSAKSKQNKDTAIELEWGVEASVAAAILGLGPYPSVQKTRYCWVGDDGKTWEVDEFEGTLAGIVLAEIELDSTDEVFTRPTWLGHEITGLRSWSNSALASMLTRRDEAR